MLLSYCSADVGRTGTLIGLKIILEQALQEGVIDVIGTIKKMRQQRMHMVQTVVIVKNVS